MTEGAERVADGLYAVTDRDSRGRESLSLIEADSETVALALYVSETVRSIVDRITDDGSIGGERLG